MYSVRLRLVSACIVTAVAAAPGSAEVLYGVFNNGNNVVTFNTAKTGTLISNYPLTGPPPATIQDVILGLSVRSETRQLYGVSGAGVYVIDPATGVKTLVAASPLATPFDQVAGASFQPGTPNLFVISYATQSLLKENVDTGVTTNLGTLAFATTDRNAGMATFVEALTWGRPGDGPAPELYGIDATVGLVAINSSNGLKTTIGPIPAFAGANSGAGFTYSDLTGKAYVDFPKENASGGTDQDLYTIDLRTGETAPVGTVDHFPAGVLRIAAGTVLRGPSCQISGIVPEPPKQFNIGFQAANSGLKSIDLVNSGNTSVNIPAFSPGSTELVLVTATKLDQTVSSDVVFRVTDMAGHVTTCRPVDFTLELNRLTEPHVFRSVNRAEHYIQIKNGTPGVAQMMFLVNGQAFPVPALNDGETYSLDIGSAISANAGENTAGHQVAGEAANTVVLYASGQRGASAAILIGDASVLTGFAELMPQP